MSAATCIVTPTHGNEDFTLRCFESIRRHTRDYRIIWVDNGSPPASRQRVAEYLDQNRVPHAAILLDENLGFGKATNLGIQRALALGARYVVLQNNDTEVFAGWMERLINAAESDPAVGLVGPLTTPCASWQAVDALKRNDSRFADLPDFAGDPEAYARVLSERFDGHRVASTIQLAFFSVLIKVGLIAQIGLLSDEFGVGFGEDDDYCFRAMKAGWKILVAKDVLVYHKHRTTFKTLYSETTIKEMLAANRERLVAKHIDRHENWKFDRLPGLDRERQLLVAFVSHSADLHGGAERSLLELLDGLPRERFYCMVLLPGPGSLAAELERRLIYYEMVSLPWWTLGPEYDTDAVARALAYALPELVGALGRLDPDVVYTNTTVIGIGALAARALGIPHVWHVREFGERDHGYDFVLPFAERSLYIAQHSALTIFNSESTRRGYGSAPGTPGTAVAYNSVTLAPPSPGAHRFFNRPASFKVAVIGNIQPGKGQRDAVLAVQALVAEGKDVELALVGAVGDDRYAQEVRELVEREGLAAQVTFTGYLPNVSDVLAQVDLVLVCSRMEAFGRVVVEAMMSGKPVLGARSGGTVELVREGETGLLYEPGNVGELTKTLRVMMSDLPALQAKGAAGRSLAARLFAEGACAREIGSLLDGFRARSRGRTAAGSQFDRAIGSALAAEVLEGRASAAKLAEAASQQRAAIAAADTRIAALDAALAAADVRIAELDAALAAGERKIAELNAAAAVRKTRIAALNAAVAAKGRRVETLRATSATLRAEVEAMRSSLRWRLFAFPYECYVRHLRRFVPLALFRLIDRLFKRRARPVAARRSPPPRGGAEPRP